MAALFFEPFLGIGGLYYFNARYYDPSTGRFINVDPIQDGSNWYVYCANNPLNMIDPTGLEDEKVVEDETSVEAADTTESTTPINPMKGGKDAAGYKVTTKYGENYDANEDKIMDTHTGVDFVSTSREVVASSSGKIAFAGEHPDGKNKATGTLVIIKYDNGEYGLYGHMDPDSIKNLKVGDAIEQGASVGKYYNGKMGRSTGGHLHYGRYKLDSPKSNASDLARQFDATGYAYSKSAIPSDNKLKEGVYSVKPSFEY